uniref:Chromosome 19 open reading frame 47 n=1 Tax=Falco tinnunculus TaxID=100819 RepID=A0A8C4U8W6_FALTI
MGLQPPCPGVLSPALSAGCSGCCRLTHPASSRSAMVSVTMATSEWIQFFKEAGIPPGPAVNYAVMFVDNRIQKNMLLDLNKEIMNELGITVVGDIIAILKHAKIVYRQEMCKAATELLCPSSPNVQAELRRNASSAASRMITNSLSRDPPPAAPLRQRPHASKISVTVSNKLAATKAGLGDMADGNPTIPVKRRRVTAEMEGKYIINMPKGTTPRTKKILEQQAAKGLQRTSVFDRLGAEAKADTTTGGKPTGVFSRLGDTLGTNRDKATDSDDDCSVLQYAGVLKKLTKPPRKESAEPTGGTVKAKATSSEAKLVTPTAIQRLSQRNIATAAVKPSSKISVIGITAVPVEAQEGDVSSTKDKNDPEFRVTIKRTWGCGKVSSTSEPPGAQMDSTGTVSVFKRLGKKPD